MKIRSALLLIMLCVFLTFSLTACNTSAKNWRSGAEIIEQETKEEESLSQEDLVATQIAIFANETMQAYTATHTATSTLTPSPTASQTPTQTPTQMLPPTQLIPLVTATPVPTRIQVNEAHYKGLSFVIPNGLNFSWTAEEIQQSPDPNGPQSEHYLFQLNYRTTGDFSQLSPYDFLPFPRLFSGTQSFRSKIKAVEFQNGSGIRFLTAYHDDYIPMSTNSLFYAFVGVTNDKNYLVAGVIPILSSPLPQTTDYPNDYDSIIHRYNQHIEEGVQLLNETPDKDFRPNLEWVDALFRSLNLKMQ